MQVQYFTYCIHTVKSRSVLGFRRSGQLYADYTAMVCTVKLGYSILHVNVARML